MIDEFNDYAHHIARNYNTEDYEDMFQQAWVYLLEAKESGLKELDCFWEARFRCNLWANYQNRLVPLPMRTGSKEMAEAQEVSNDIQDNTFTTGDHAEAYENYSEVLHMRKNLRGLSEFDRRMLYDIYFSGLSFRDLAKKRGHNKDWWQKYHSNILNRLKVRQERK